MKIIHWSVRHSVGVIMLVLAAMVVGGVALSGLAIDLYPKMNLPIAAVATSYQGAAPEEVEKLVSKPIESALSSVQGIDTISSTSESNASLVILQFNWGVNIETALNDVREKLDQVIPVLPDDAERPRVMRFDPQQIPVMWVGLTGAPLDQLQNLAEETIQPNFERVNGVASAGISGGKTREIQVSLDQAKLDGYGITPAQVSQALSSENQSTSAGSLKKGIQDLQLRVNGEFTSVADIANTLIPLPKGGQVKVSDVATVSDTFKEMTTISKVNDQPSLVFTVMKQSEANTVKVSDGMNKAIENMQRQLPEGVKLSVILDTATFIRQSIQSVVEHMMVGAVLAVAVLYLFLRSIRSTLVIGLAIPIALISTFTLMYFTGETLNVLSMGGLALGIGMMLDSAVVILENIFSHRERGVPILQAATDGASEVGGAVIAMTTTHIVVFLPIVFVEGLAAQLFRPLAMTVSFSLVAALIVSLTLIPMLASKLLGGGATIATSGSTTSEAAQAPYNKYTERKKGGPIGRVFDRFFIGLNRFYLRILKWALGHRKTIFWGSGALIVASLMLVPMIGMEFIPETDQGQITINLKTQEGASLEETEAVVQKVNQQLKPFEQDIETNYVSIGGGGFGFGGTSSNEASFTIQLVEKSDREVTTNELIDQIQAAVKDIPGAEIKVSAQEIGMGTGSPIQVNISGSDWNVLQELSQQVVWLVSEVQGTANVESSVDEGRPEMQVIVNREVAAQYGLTYQQVMSAVRTAFSGQVATKYRDNGEEVDVRVIFPEGERETINDLEKMTVQTPAGVSIPLASVAQLKQVQGPVAIQRENQQRQVNVTADVRGRDLGSVSREIRQKLDQLDLPDGYSISFGGQSEDMAESFSSLGMALVLSIFLVYLVMAVQFESFLYPFIMMFSLPSTLIGILVGLFVTGKPLSIPAFIGVIMLGGIVVSNAIVLVDYVNILRGRGKARQEALLEGGSSRLRPILMTTLTTVLGMVPLAVGIGEGSESQAPMAIVIIFGLLFSTLVTLVLVPVMYTYLDDFSGWLKRLFRRKRQTGDLDVTG